MDKGYEAVRVQCGIPIVIGEVFDSIWHRNKLIEMELIDFIQVAVTYAGGITPVKGIVDLAGMHDVRTGFHGVPSHSPISMTAQAHPPAGWNNLELLIISFLVMDKIGPR